jgi:uncharacterized protein YktB (UPF0637 family)
MNTYQLVVYEANSGKTKVGIFENDILIDLLFLENDNKQYGYNNSWVKMNNKGINKALTESELLYLLDHDRPSNYSILDIWQE